KQQRVEMYKALKNAGKKEKIFEQKADSVLKKFAEEETAANLGKIVKRSGLEKFSDIEVNESQIRLVLNTPVLFDSGRAQLRNETKKILDGIARTFSLTKDKIIIEGHTDNIPIRSSDFKSNWELSARRAVNVINYFVKKGFPPERFIAAGYGEYFPRFSNATAEGRMKNRRIEIVLLKGELE
ncbi:MAG: OmpA family protein, partial [Elusimicrobia bacterium]|nr:OmpA family protein [Elusimicrobiota bacterium]